LRRTGTTNLVLWGAIGLVAALAGVLLWTSGALQVSNPRRVVAATASASPTASPTATATPDALELTATAAAALAGPVPAATLSLPEITAPAGGQVYLVTPVPNAAGWVREGDESPNHLGDHNIYAGVFGGQRHLGAIQFDLSGVPPGVPIAYADLTLVGLASDWLNAEGAWRVQLLQSWLDDGWSQRTFSDLALPAAVAAELEPTLTVGDLAAGQANRLVFGPEALRTLELRTLRGRVSFRVAGPVAGADNLFSWDSGYGTGSQGWRPLLRMAAGPAPETLPATPTPQYVLITVTPTPANFVTRAAATMQAITTGTPTPLPLNWVTPAIVVPTPTPANLATAQWHAAMATAEVLLFGTQTPLPVVVWTAAPEAHYVVITNTPTPILWATAVAEAAADATRRAGGWVPTPFPGDWATETPRPDYRLVTSTPWPRNEATATALSARATLVALRTGTYTPMPDHWVTATPLPLTIPLDEITPTPTPVPTPDEIPSFLRGKIAFFSDRLGRSELFVMDADGSNVAWLTQSYPYNLAREREVWAPDGVRSVSLQEDSEGRPQLYVSGAGGTARAITSQSEPAGQPAWSPLGDQIAFVLSLPGNDEVYRVNADGSRLTRLTTNNWAVDRHPSWSPDGQQIVFYTIRDSGRRQIWVMGADGSGKKEISNNEHNDWDPIWLK
jgi:hypothetical protein